MTGRHTVSHSAGGTASWVVVTEATAAGLQLRMHGRTGEPVSALHLTPGEAVDLATELLDAVRRTGGVL